MLGKNQYHLPQEGYCLIGIKDLKFNQLFRFKKWGISSDLNIYSAWVGKSLEKLLLQESQSLSLQ
jgi:hypothetical protein